MFQVDTFLDDLQEYTLRKAYKASNFTTSYRQNRLDIIDGVNAKAAIGMIVPGKKGDLKYTVSDFKYDIGIGVLKLVSRLPHRHIAPTSRLPHQHLASSKPIKKCKCPVLCDNSAGGALAYKCLWHIQSALWHSRAQIASYPRQKGRTRGAARQYPRRARSRNYSSRSALASGTP